MDDLNDALITIINTAQRACERQADPVPNIVEREGREYLVKGGGLVLLSPPRPNPVDVNSLSAVVDFLESNRDDLNVDKLLVHVVGPRLVRVVSSIDDVDCRREHYLSATPPVDDVDLFSVWMDPETFVISMMTRFAPTEARDALLALVGTVQEDAVKQVNDDGLAQQVTARMGVKATTETVRNPHSLVAFRSFPEIDLDAAPYVLRMRGGGEGALPKVALFEADGGRWVLDALAKIRAFLAERLPEGIAIIC